MKLTEFTHFYFIGIGGIGMSALARLFKKLHKTVAGYDKTPSSLTNELIQDGILVHYEDDIALIPKPFLNPKTTLIIWTPAIPKEHQELCYFQQNGYTVKKRAEVLGMISEEYFTIAVAGTHGKTTTASILAHILHEAGLPVMALLGGISVNFQSNLLYTRKANEKTILVVEADEYDRSFWQLSPDWAIITAVEPDHLDIYGTAHHVEESFKVFAQKINPENGKIWINEKFKWLLGYENHIKTYGVESGDIAAKNIKVEDYTIKFDVFVENHLLLSDVKLSIPGKHNVENAVAAIAVALELRVSSDKIIQALRSYLGVKRRFEYIFKGDKFIYIDDYAHHPTEIRAFIDGVRMLYPNRKLAIIFQPHLFSRTRDFAEEFAESLSWADYVYIMDIYPAREKPIHGVTSKIIYDAVRAPLKTYVHDELQLLNIIRNTDAYVIATVGAGDIDRFVPKIAKILTAREIRDLIMELRNQYQVAQEKISSCARDINLTLNQLPYHMHTSTDTDKLALLHRNKAKIQHAVAYCQDTFLVIDAKIDEIDTMIRYCNQVIQEAMTLVQ
ncbi:MAG: UDP-N-acetylmuramate--L-alanine ligase [Cytophagales bacterium]|nr:UDP-N-acetylmuramate--L-alanine ligase [Cytophagales bacterium]MDW8385177.1 UDP-N-acetylmuramate--L-alanine ligase [Flammeovirgaceae bacterium]